MSAHVSRKQKAEGSRKQKAVGYRTERSRVGDKATPISDLEQMLGRKGGSLDFRHKIASTGPIRE